MDRKFLVKFAFRNLMTHRMRTLLTLGGVTIGIAAVVFLVSFGSGIQRLVTEQITGGDAFQLIDVGTGNSQVVRFDQSMVDKTAGISGVTLVETVTNLAGKVIKDGNSTMDLAVFAATPNYISWSGKNIRYGNSLAADNLDGVVVNTALLKFTDGDKPETNLGKKLQMNIIVPKELSGGESINYGAQEFNIIGIIKDDSTPLVYISQKNLSKYGVDLFSQGKIRVADRNQVPTIRKQLEALGLKTEYVGDTVNQVEQVFSVFKIVLGSFGFIALLVALLGMFNTLTISLLERIKEVALLKILGMGRSDIKRLFMLESIMIGITGGACGIIVGVVFGSIANLILNFFATRAGGDPVSVFYYSLTLMVTIVLLAIVIGIVTGIYPSKRAAKINALDVLRYE